jgi:hypothetical protein
VKRTGDERVTHDVRLQETGRAFTRVAGYYDGPAGNNAVIQRMRTKMWQTLMATFPAGSRLLELGCGTGIDADVHWSLGASHVRFAVAHCTSSAAGLPALSASATIRAPRESGDSCPRNG